MLPAGVLDELNLLFNSSKTPAGSILGEYYQILQIQLSAPDDGQKHRPTHVELTWNSKLIYIVHLVGYLRNRITMHGFTNVKCVSADRQCRLS